METLAVHAAATTGKDGEAEIIIDSAATITALKSVDQMVDTHASKRKIHGFAKGSGINAATDGKANMWLFDPESGDGAGATVPAVAFEELRILLSICNSPLYLGNSITNSSRIQ